MGCKRVENERVNFKKGLNVALLWACCATQSPHDSSQAKGMRRYPQSCGKSAGGYMSQRIRVRIKTALRVTESVSSLSNAGLPLVRLVTGGG